MRSSRLSSGLRRKPAVMTTTLLVLTSLMSPAMNALIRDEAGPVQEIERDALGHVLVGVDEADVAGDAAAHCRAYAVMLPTRPPPPMMLTFMRVSVLGPIFEF